MKFILILMSLPAFAGQVSYSNMYSKNTFVQGVGTNSLEAEKDAMTAIPVGYIKDPDNSPAIQCQGLGIPLEKNNGGCDQSHGKNLVQITIPIIKKTK